MFNITWKHICFECCCPLAVKITIIVNTEDKFCLFCRDFTSWCYLKPFCLLRNNYYYKFYGLGVRRVCASCYHYPMRRISLLNREIGKKVTMNKIIRSKTSQEIYNYFNSFIEFRKRSLEVCIVEEPKRKFIKGLLAFWQVDEGTVYQILY